MAYKLTIEKSRDGEPYQVVGRGTWSGDENEAYRLLTPKIEDIPEPVTEALVQLQDEIVEGHREQGGGTYSVGDFHYRFSFVPVEK